MMLYLTKCNLLQNAGLETIISNLSTILNNMATIINNILNIIYVTIYSYIFILILIIHIMELPELNESEANR